MIYISLQLPASDMLNITVLPYTRMYTVIYEFYKIENVIFESNSSETFSKQIAIAENNGE